MVVPMLRLLRLGPGGEAPREVTGHERGRAEGGARIARRCQRWRRVGMMTIRRVEGGWAGPGDGATLRRPLIKWRFLVGNYESMLKRTLTPARRLHPTEMEGVEGVAVAVMEGVAVAGCEH